MRKEVLDAVDNAKETLLDVFAAAGQPELTDAEVIDRYVRQHRGQPSATLEYVARTAPEGKGLLQAAAEYEEKMEALLEEQKNGI